MKRTCRPSLMYELEMLEPGVGQRAEGRAASCRLASRLLVRTRMRLRPRELLGLDERRDTSARLELRQLTRRRPTLARSPPATVITDDPGAGTEPATQSHSVGVRRSRTPSVLRHLTAQTGSPVLTVSTSRNAVARGSFGCIGRPTVHPLSDERTTSGPTPPSGPASGPKCRDFGSLTALQPLQNPHSRANRRPSKCLPCRRSRVRVPSSASHEARLHGGLRRSQPNVKT